MKTLLGNLLAFAFVALSITCAAPRRTIAATASMQVTRQLDGDVTHFRMHAIAFFDSGHSVTFVAPDGTTFGPGSPTQVEGVPGLAESELTSRFAGLWTIYDSLGLPAGSPVQSHQFSLTASQLTSGYPAYPEVFTPADGAIVPRTFEYAGSANGVRVDGGSGNIIVSGGKFKFAVDFSPGELSRNLAIRMFAQNVIFDGTATPVTPNPAHPFDMMLVRNSLSQPHNVTALNVPEPQGIALGLIGCIAPFVIGRTTKRRLIAPN